MKKSLFLCVFACFVLTRPVLADWMTCEQAARKGYITTDKAADTCGIHYYKGEACYYDSKTGNIRCLNCPAGYSGTCTQDGDCSKCYKTCVEPCDKGLDPIGCPKEYDPCKEFYLNENTTCNTGIEYYDEPGKCIPSGKCQCTFDIPGPYSYCPEGYRDCEITYNRDKVAPEEVCCKNLTGGTYVSKAGGDAVPCLDGYYCPGGQLYYNKTGILEQCPKYGTSGPGSADITECYVPAGTTFDYGAGTGSSSYDCYYEK